ncbi:MAG: ATP-binding cassette domain-containing protein [Halorientalis sp.]
MITVEDLAVSRGGTEVLTDVSLRVGDGEFVALVGPNGAGKTTLLQTVNGLLDPDAGRVAVAGRDVSACDAREVGRLVATVPQHSEVGFDFAVRDVVAMGRTPYRSRVGRTDVATERRLVEEALARTETEALADRSIDEVSGGERRRVLLARALAQDTPALVLDEPTASLDINHRVRTLELVADLVAEGKTALAAIHDLDLAARFCDRMVLLGDGRVRAAGRPESVLESDVLGDVFHADATVATAPATGTPSVTALRERGERDLRVHVVGGGPAAARSLALLDAAGATATAGPLPAGDVAAETARARSLDAVTAPPFCDVPADVREGAADRRDAADVVALAVRPDGPTPAAVEAAAAAECPVVVVEDPNAEAESVAGGEPAGDGGDRRYARLRERAAVAAPENVVAAVTSAARAADLPADD